MAKTTAPLLPATAALLAQLGERLRAARLRRQLSAKHMAERAGMSVMTLRHLEHGGAGVTLGAYVAVMQVLGIEQDLGLLGKDDPVGRGVQDTRLPQRVRQRAPRRPVTPPAAPTPQAYTPTAPRSAWVQEGGFASAQALALLLDSGKGSAPAGDLAPSEDSAASAPHKKGLP
ncbi:MAG: helix-turn-helix domain-containing protein [Rhodoferax sp.]